MKKTPDKSTSSERRASERRPAHLFRSLVGESPGIAAVQQLIDQVAATDSTVLITGESGTGKEVVARNIHYRSSRRDGPFVPVNCAAIPDELVESELFGHEKGAFTGAVNSRKGRFELAHQGTLFLDEIGDMPLGAQTKMLRVIQERVFEKLGGSRSIPTDVRIIAATHCDLGQRIEENLFRMDLFYRLNVFPIEMPSLRERAADIPLLLRELVERLRHETGLSVEFSAKAIDCLMRQPWEGNVRQLANAVERLAILHPNRTVDAIDLPADMRGSGVDVKDAGAEAGPRVENIQLIGANLSMPPDGVDLKQHLCDVERVLIRKALDASDGVVAHAADLLHMGRTTLVEKMRRYDIRDNLKTSRTNPE